MTRARDRRMAATKRRLDAGEALTSEEVRRETLVALAEGDHASIPGWLTLLISVARREGIEHAAGVAMDALNGGGHGEAETQHQG